MAACHSPRPRSRRGPPRRIPTGNERRLREVTSRVTLAVATNGAKWDLFVFKYYTQLVLIVGMLALGVGLFVAVPVVLIAYASAYQQLFRRV